MGAVAWNTDAAASRSRGMLLMPASTELDRRTRSRMARISREPAEDAGLPLDRCRELLGREAEALSDEQLTHVRHHALLMAHTLIDLFQYLERLAEPG
jgi:hypothetical protein